MRLLDLANPIEAPPFYGYPVKAQLTFTYGGLKCDLESRVLATNGAPIPNLHCAGELSGICKLALVFQSYWELTYREISLQ